MPLHDVRQPPAGFSVLYDPETDRYFPMRRADGDRWENMFQAGKVVSFTRRWRAVDYCERVAHKVQDDL